MANETTNPTTEPSIVAIRKFREDTETLQTEITITRTEITNLALQGDFEKLMTATETLKKQESALSTLRLSERTHTNGRHTDAIREQVKRLLQGQATGKHFSEITEQGLTVLISISPAQGEGPKIPEISINTVRRIKTADTKPENQPERKVPTGPRHSLKAFYTDGAETITGQTFIDRFYSEKQKNADVVKSGAWPTKFFSPMMCENDKGLVICNHQHDTQIHGTQANWSKVAS